VGACCKRSTGKIEDNENNDTMKLGLPLPYLSLKCWLRGGVGVAWSVGGGVWVAPSWRAGGVRSRGWCRVGRVLWFGSVERPKHS